MALGSKTVDKLTKQDAAGKHTPSLTHDENGLYLQVTREGADWLLRFTFAGKRRIMGLGNLADLGLANAREKAQKQRTLVAQGTDPVLHRAEARQAANDREPSATFRHFGEMFIEQKADIEWRSDHDKRHIRRVFATYVYPKIGDTPIRRISIEHVLATLTQAVAVKGKPGRHPFWTAKHPLAARTRHFMSRVFEYSRGLSGGLAMEARNPADRLALSKLATGKRVHKVKGYVQMDYNVVPAFAARLRAIDTIPARALELLILTGARSRVVRLAQWGQFDLTRCLWTIPDLNEKSEEPLVVPLGPRAVEILTALQPDDVDDDDYVFPSASAGRKHPRSHAFMWNQLRFMGITKAEATGHGFRKVLSTWAAEERHHDKEIVEAALSHSQGGLRGIYQTGALLKKRRVLMSDLARCVHLRSDGGTGTGGIATRPSD